MKQIFDVPPLTKQTESLNSNDDNTKVNQSKSSTVKINCEVDQDTSELRIDRQTKEKETFT